MRRLSRRDLAVGCKDRERDSSYSFEHARDHMLIDEFIGGAQCFAR